MKEHRDTKQISIRERDHRILTDLKHDKSLRVMVFCTDDSKGSLRDVAFPLQSELKVNGGDFKANLRGLKKKPGSTRPVDITSELRFKNENYTNNVSLTYALTDKANEPSSYVRLLLHWDSVSFHNFHMTIHVRRSPSKPH